MSLLLIFFNPGSSLHPTGKRHSDQRNVAIKKIDMKTVKRWSQMREHQVPIEFSLYRQAAQGNDGKCSWPAVFHSL